MATDGQRGWNCGDWCGYFYAIAAASFLDLFHNESTLTGYRFRRFAVTANETNEANETY